MKPRMVEYYMKVAELTAGLSRARRLQVGCVIVKDDNIISFGWNGTPPGWDNNCEDTVWHSNGERTLKTRPEVIHAEANALMKLCRAHSSSYGASLFLTHAPCVECAKMISSAGIDQVFYRQQYRNQDGINLLAKSNILMTEISKYRHLVAEEDYRRKE